MMLSAVIHLICMAVFEWDLSYIYIFIPKNTVTMYCIIIDRLGDGGYRLYNTVAAKMMIDFICLFLCLGKWTANGHIEKQVDNIVVLYESQN